jgi:hypothetical protein
MMESRAMRRGSAVGALIAAAMLVAVLVIGLPSASADVGSVAGGTDSGLADSPLFDDAGVADSTPSGLALTSARTLPGFQGGGSAIQATTTSGQTQAMFAAVDQRITTARHSLTPPPRVEFGGGLVNRIFERFPHGFDGIDNADQAVSGTGIYAQTNGTITPPDQGLCVGNGFVLELANGGVRVFNQLGDPLTPTIQINQFFGTPPDIAPDGQSGHGLSDPRCAYDPATQRWFLIVTGFDTGPPPAFVFTHAYVHLIVSTSADPRGPYTDYSFETTNFGRAGSNRCPCYSDQPHLALDANGVYINANQFTFATNRFNSNRLFILSKQGLIDGTIQFFFTRSTNVPSLQGATPLTSADTDQTGNGTEYFLSSAVFSSGASGLFMFSLSGTRSLADESGATTVLSYRISSLLPAEQVSEPPLVTQRPGPTPFATAQDLPEPQLDPGPSIFQQLVLAGGQLWGAAGTGLTTAGQNHSAAAWFTLTPTGPTATNPAPTATITQQGYIQAPGNDLAYPTIALTGNGKPVLGADLAGPDFYPSTVYTRLPTSSGVPADTVLHIAGEGTAPLDDYSYPYLGFNRWGDYTAAVNDGNTVWLAGEYVPRRPRTSDANWGTFITRIGGE